MLALSRTVLGLGLLLLLTATGCGGDVAGRLPDAVKGPYVRVSGFAQRTFSVSAQSTKLECIPRTGLNQFELKAGDIDANEEALYINYRGYNGESIPRTTLTYEAAPLTPLFSVTLAGPDKGYRFSYFQHLRSDTSEWMPSVCDFELLRTEKENGDQHFAGSLVCSMLWADATRDAFDGTKNINNYVDLVASFECDYGF